MDKITKRLPAYLNHSYLLQFGKPLPGKTPGDGEFTLEAYPGLVFVCRQVILGQQRGKDVIGWKVTTRRDS